MFTGFILESELEYEIFGSQTARLRAVSQSYAMDVTPRRKYYFQKTPQEVAQLLTGAAGLGMDGTVAGQKLSFVQMEETDFRFLLRFVDESEKWLRPSASGVEVRDAFQPGKTLSWRGEYGLVQFHTTGKLGARQLAGSHYDYRKMQSKVLSGVENDPALYSSSAKMSAAVKAEAAKLGPGFVTARERLLSVDDLSPRLQKESRRSTGKMVLCRGVSREQGLKAGDEVTVDGVLDANGTYGLVRVEHRWTVNGYENDFLCTPWRRYTAGEAVPVPRFDGVVPARVVHNNDPEGIGRIQVQYYWQEDSFTCWIRAMTPHAGADRGVFCLPEIGDEVWVMCEEGDPERGRILGAAWNGKMQPPREELWGGDVGPNDLKRVVTKSGHRISLDDKPGKNAIVVATPEHVKLSMMESSNETGDAMLALHSDGDVFLSAPAGRIHFHSKFWSREVGGGGSAAGPTTVGLPPLPIHAQPRVVEVASTNPAKSNTKRDSPRTCTELWNGISAKAGTISNIQDPQERNRKISAAYARLYQANNRLAWVGLAAIVSRQAGCAMKLAEDASGSWIPPKSQAASTAFKALGQTNEEIFSDIYPVALFYEENGSSKLKDCAVDENGVRHASPKLVSAFEAIDKGSPQDVRAGSDKLAAYEQRDVIQDNIYSKEEYREAFERNEWWAQHSVGRWMGARRTELPLSSQCTDHNAVPFTGSISDPDARVAYYNRLMDSFQDQSPEWRQQTMEQIESLGR